MATTVENVMASLRTIRKRGSLKAFTGGMNQQQKDNFYLARCAMRRLPVPAASAPAAPAVPAVPAVPAAPAAPAVLSLDILATAAAEATATAAATAAISTDPLVIKAKTVLASMCSTLRQEKEAIFKKCENLKAKLAAVRKLHEDIMLFESLA